MHFRSVKTTNSAGEKWYNDHINAKAVVNELTVWIDVLIVINVCITYFTLRAVSGLLHLRPRFVRIAAASVLGGFSSLTALLDAGIIAFVMLRAALTVSIVLTAFGFGGIRELLIRSFLCAAVGMLLCGAAMLTHELTGTELIFAANGFVYINVSSLVLVGCSAGVYAVLLLVRRILDSPSSDEPVLLTAEMNGRRAVMSAVSDSGNFLRDFLTGRPVIVCRKESVEDIMPANMSGYLSGNTEDVTGIRIIPAETVAGSVIIAAFLPDRVTVDVKGKKKCIDALIGVSDTAMKNEHFDAVIPSKLLQ